MFKKSIIAIILLFPVITFSQETTKKTEKTDDQPRVAKQNKFSTNISTLAKYSNLFKITKTNFSRRTDYRGRGEVLEVEMTIENQTDDPIDLYVFVIASYEKKEHSKSSFVLPIPRKERIRSFVPYPLNPDNFIYPDLDEKKIQKKDQKGNNKFIYFKFPKNYKLGVNPETKKPYHITTKKFIRTEHLSNYRNNYYFFNEVTILVFDTEGKPVYRQLYQLRGFRR